MALIQVSNPANGGQPIQELAGYRDTVERSTPFSSGYAIPLTETPVDTATIIVFSEGMILYPDDWSYNAGTNEVEILFGADPATDTADGIWHFFVQYLYEA